MSIFANAPDNFHPVRAAEKIVAAPKDQRRPMLEEVPEAWRDFVFTMANNTLLLKIHWRKRFNAGEYVPPAMLEFIGQ